MTLRGFADLDRERAVRPAPGTPAPASRTPLDGEQRTGDAFLDRLSPATREATLRRLGAAGRRDPRKVSQEELDEMSDDEKWLWLSRTCEREQSDQEQAAATAAQTAMPYEAWVASQGGTP